MRLYDTAKKQVAELTLREPGKVSMYICGPTVYDVPHVGHGRYVLVFDVLRRYLEWSGNEVRFVSNITDVDDKIIAKANKDGRSESEVAKEYEDIWYDSLDHLGVKRPDDDPHATAYIEKMVGLIGQLVEKGSAYQTSDGIYFSTESLSDYGLLAGQPLESLRSGARVEVTEEKRNPLDFALWKVAKPGEPTWPSPWGEGRPGWHTECVVMSTDILKDDFDIHGGGLDLTFPHHENERAQAVALGNKFAAHWVHNGLVEVGGEKMSKSLGNFTVLTELLETFDPRAYRLLVLQSHYRAPIEVSRETAEQASRSLERLDDFARRVSEFDGPTAALDSSELDKFRSHMDDDLDTPAAMALMFDLIRRANSSLDKGESEAAAPLAATVFEIGRAVGLEPKISDSKIDPQTSILITQRDEARSNGDFSKADEIRNELIAQGWDVEDTPSGTRVHRS